VLFQKLFFDQFWKVFIFESLTKFELLSCKFFTAFCEEKCYVCFLFECNDTIYGDELNMPVMNKPKKWPCGPKHSGDFPGLLDQKFQDEWLVIKPM
jgi:hypothetical protein